MRRHRAARIVSTLGPSSSSPECIRALFEAGTDVFRLNFSHGTHAEHKQRFDIVRGLEAEFDHPAGIIMDLQGPKIRVGAFAGGSVQLEAGAGFRLDGNADETGSAERASITNPEIFASLETGRPLLLDDGKIRLRVTEAGADFAQTEIEVGGVLSDAKGVNIPGALLALSALTAKDRSDLQFGLDLGADWVALSFVQRPEDVAEARKLIAGRAGILVKLEKPLAIQHLDQIVELADAVMVARGDLGVEAPPEDVPGLQKEIIAKARDAGKPVIVATQMLESMVNAPTPTRAEASDVATAVFDGADAVMLSAETAAGTYPVESVAMMDRIVARVEKDPLFRGIMDATHEAPEATAQDAITAAARQVARTVSAAAIVTYTSSGSTSLRAARARPDVPVLCLTERPETARKLAMAWGLQCIIAEDVQDFDDMVSKACRVARDGDFAKPGDRLVITAGVPFGTPGATNILRIATIDD